MFFTEPRIIYQDVITSSHLQSCSPAYDLLHVVIIVLPSNCPSDLKYPLQYYDIRFAMPLFAHVSHILTPEVD